MTEEEVYQATVSAFYKLTVAELTSAILGSPVTSAQYGALSIEDRASLAREIEGRSLRIARRVADKLRRKGLLDGSASPGIVNQVYRETLQELSTE
jgi:hypothetical protein